MDLGISGRRAVVTGGAGGIGLATARDLLAEGVEVVLTDTDAGSLARAVAELGRDVPTVVADLSTPDGARTVAEAAGDVDVLVHAAGVTGAKGDPLEPTEEDWAESFHVDLMSGVRMAKALVPGMAERGWGRVVFVTSENAAQSYPDEVVYNVAKVGVASFAKALSQVYARKGVLVNCVQPAFIETPMTDAMMESKAEEEGTSVDDAIAGFLAQDRPHLVLERRGRADEVAGVIAFLCSERASFVVGSGWRVDGGSVLALDL